MFCKECRNFMGEDEFEMLNGVCDDCFADAEQARANDEYNHSFDDPNETDVKTNRL